MDPQPMTYAELVHHGVQTADPSGDAELTDLLDAYEDRDEALHTPDVFRAELEEELGKLDPEQEDGALQMAAAVAMEIAYRHASVEADRTTLLRLAARATFPDGPPASVEEFLEREGVAT